MGVCSQANAWAGLSSRKWSEPSAMESELLPVAAARNHTKENAQQFFDPETQVYNVHTVQQQVRVEEGSWSLGSGCTGGRPSCASQLGQARTDEWARPIDVRP
ncbi:uncharacterized protein VDAG_09936 [Verticillium dahliae VdLs.17]|uniref:Uncharacterized protein n=1 Tax=Verticillium dahliae (strain VdLs.17 / ATCC MYA-4575 / FGSC 10137) TaxID=498257 RepID=G2XIF4_VERDV|nr:uncharacterized protein VDAG_09936 [Verticillium dahliae VdLs.17]EGY19602.1 hypothetical protein VDAG_09936 [Verticillium dahliae VdLs.17]